MDHKTNEERYFRAAARRNACSMTGRQRLHDVRQVSGYVTTTGRARLYQEFGYFDDDWSSDRVWTQSRARARTLSSKDAGNYGVR